MAAKAPAAKKTAKAKVTPKATVHTAKPKGLQLSTAQRKAYRTAYAAAAHQVRQQRAFQAAVNRLQKYRLGAANATMQKYNAYMGVVHAAATAAYATKLTWMQSRAGHQNKALQARIELDMYNHANVLGRLQYGQAGEKAYVNRAVMRTLDDAQANAYERQVWNKIAKTAKKATRSTFKSVSKPTATSKAAAAAGAAAGTKAANAPGLVRAAKAAKQAKAKQRHAAASKKGKATAAATVKRNQQARKSSQARGAKSKKAPVAKAKARTAYMGGMLPGLAGKTKPTEPKPWLGNETDPHCIAFAIANHLQKIRSVTATEDDIAELVEAAGPDASIEETLWQAYLLGWPSCSTVHLGDYQEVEREDMQAQLNTLSLVIGYDHETPEGVKGHAALSLPVGQVVTWGQLDKLPAEVDEAWTLRWDV
jgi:hypothetical protein